MRKWDTAVLEVYAPCDCFVCVRVSSLIGVDPDLGHSKDAGQRADFFAFCLDVLRKGLTSTNAATSCSTQSTLVTPSTMVSLLPAARSYDSEDTAAPLYFTEKALHSRFFGSMPPKIVADLAAKPYARESHSHGLSLASFEASKVLKEEYEVLSLSTDPEGEVGCSSTMTSWQAINGLFGTICTGSLCVALITLLSPTRRDTGMILEVLEPAGKIACTGCTAFDRGNETRNADCGREVWGGDGGGDGRLVCCRCT